jgi:hypothetical protein
MKLRGVTAAHVGQLVRLRVSWCGACLTCTTRHCSCARGDACNFATLSKHAWGARKLGRSPRLPSLHSLSPHRVSCILGAYCACGLPLRLQGVVTNISDVRPLATVVAYADVETGNELYQTVSE